MTVSILLLTLILPLTWKSITSPGAASLRGVAVSQDGTMCVAGNGPNVWVSDNDGGVWYDRTPHREGVTDYRCVAMPADNLLMVASAGTPAVILRSEDSGRTWNTVHRDPRPSAFIDGLRFWDAKRGVAFGDPVDGKFLLLSTDDGGRSWHRIHCDIEPLAGEAGFAASNGSMALAGQSSVLIGLGGRVDLGHSRVLRSSDGGQNWDVVEVAEMPAGASSGIFSVANGESGFAVAVGGDYQLTEQSVGNIAVTEDGGASWRLPSGRRPDGFRSSVIFVPTAKSENGAMLKKGYWLATGPTGTDVSDDGEDWQSLGATGFHALSLLPDRMPLATGSDGRVARLTKSE